MSNLILKDLLIRVAEGEIGVPAYYGDLKCPGCGEWMLEANGLADHAKDCPIIALVREHAPEWIEEQEEKTRRREEARRLEAAEAEARERFFESIGLHTEEDKNDALAYSAIHNGTVEDGEFKALRMYAVGARVSQPSNDYWTLVADIWDEAGRPKVFRSYKS